jgi:hypothetical protein
MNCGLKTSISTYVAFDREYEGGWGKYCVFKGGNLY